MKKEVPCPAQSATEVVVPAVNIVAQPVPVAKTMVDLKFYKFTFYLECSIVLRDCEGRCTPKNCNLLVNLFSIHITQLATPMMAAPIVAAPTEMPLNTDARK